MSIVPARPLVPPARPTTSALVRAEVGRRLPRPVRDVVDPAVWRAALHLLLDLPIGIAGMVVVLGGVVGAAMSFALPVVVLALVLVRLLGRAERARAASLLGVVLPDPYQVLPPDVGLFRRGRSRVSDPALWREMGYLLVVFWLGLLHVVVLGVFLGVAWRLARLPLLAVQRLGQTVADGQPLPGTGPLPALAVTLLLGLGLLLLVPVLIRAMARLDATVARALLGPSARRALTAQVESLGHARALSVAAAEGERRRIERDLHDGAQQRLVALAMDLGMAREKLDSDPLRARELVEEAHGEAKRALAELRDLARGIHPAVLGDRGLDAALSALAARCPVPVRVEVGSNVGRPPVAVEAAAYFVVCEALTNVARHARATTAGVAVRREPGRLVVEVYDDGRGGAEEAGGTGLAGLTDRVRGLDGVLLVASPVGGPTLVTAELPCPELPGPDLPGLHLPGLHLPGPDMSWPGQPARPDLAVAGRAPAPRATLFGADPQPATAGTSQTAEVRLDRPGDQTQSLPLAPPAWSPYQTWGPHQRRRRCQRW